jgi:hypothetical protein
MLKITARPQWTHNVTISVPVNGGFENQDCRVTYGLFDEDSIEPTATPDPMVLLRGMVIRIDELADDDGKPLEWNDQVRDLVFKLPFVQTGLIRGYYRSVTGAREGNSSGPGALGQRAN